MAKEETITFLKAEDARRMVESVAYEYDLQKKPLLAIMHPNDFKKLAEKIDPNKIDGYIIRESKMVEEGNVYVFKRKDLQLWEKGIQTTIK